MLLYSYENEFVNFCLLTWPTYFVHAQSLSCV